MSPPFFPALLRLLRPRQWVKSLVCFAGAFFSGNLGQPQTLLRAFIAAAAFCAAASFVYVVNDILDRERDRKHPWKKFRPIASGQVSIPAALALAGGMAGCALVLGSCVSGVVVAILACYAVLNILYSAVLKTMSLVDGTIVATGFILRIYAGTAAARVLPSAWILLCTFFLALFLAFGKRRAEINSAQKAIREQGGAESEQIGATRAVLHKYNVAMLDRFCNICATLTIATYALFTVLGHATHALIVTTPPVVMGIFRYLLLVEREHEGEAPDAILLKDWGIQLAILLWVALYVAVLYFGLRIDVQ